MGLTLKRLYVDFLRQRYQGTKSRKLKAMLLDQLCRDAGYHRKHAIRVMNQRPNPRRRRGRKRTYSDGSCYHLRKLWLQMDQANGRRMKKMLPRWTKQYRTPGFGPFIRQELVAMSHATIDRILRPYRAEVGRRFRTGTKAAKLKHRIPIKPFDRNVAVPGYLEADTVAHCGESMSGEFVWSLTGTDRLTGWTEVRAVWNKLARDVVEAMQDIEDHLPFVIKGLSTDNGGEFLNELLIGHLAPSKKRNREIFMTRGRPYKKNDQCYVEQKNYTHVRKLLGYDRLDCPKVKPLLNDLYRNEWSDYQNFFIPQVKLIEKTRVGGKYKRKHSEPMTPFERLMESAMISEEEKQKLRAKEAALNPFELKAGIEKKLKAIWDTQRQFEQTRNRRSVAPTLATSK
jgi:hypothetical protein